MQTATETVREALAVRTSGFPLIGARYLPSSDPYTLLRDEFIDAWTTGPATVIDTPAYAKKQHTLAEVVADDFSGRDGGGLAELIQLVAQAAEGHNVRLLAQAWIATRAKKHAEFHADDKADAMRGDL